MRLGDPANMSLGRTSTSTMDDAFSGRADCASSMTDEAEDESDVEKESHTMEQSLDPIVNRKRPAGVANLQTNGAEGYDEAFPQAKRHKSGTKSTSSHDRIDPTSKKTSKISKLRSIMPHKKPKPATGSVTANNPMSPASLPPQSRKSSAASLMGPPQLPFSGEPDLSTKPRCQRCRKSKKGCDRQRPCQRCKDAGIGIEGCVSEDEGNGRKGRFGRHMGVAIPQEKATITPSIEGVETSRSMDPLAEEIDMNKKRKR